MNPVPRATVYTVPDCADCQAVKRLLSAHGVAYTERDVRADEAARAEMFALAQVRVAPVTVLDAQVFYGAFSDQRPRLEALLHGEAATTEVSDKEHP
jgi:glutaredoxin